MLFYISHLIDCSNFTIDQFIFGRFSFIMLLSIALFIQFSTLWVSSNCQNTFDSSQINLQLENNVTTNWENKTSINWGLFEINNETVLISLSKFELELTCQSPFPIQWNLTGHIGDPDFVQIQPYKRKIVGDNDFIFKLRLLIFFHPDANVTAAATRIYCQHAQFPEIQKSYAVFLRNGTKKY